MMKQLTVRGVDDFLDQRLKQEAQEKGISVNRYVLEVLRDATGQLEQTASSPRFHDLDHLAGTWDEAMLVEFEALTAEQRPIDEVLWA